MDYISLIKNCVIALVGVASFFAIVGVFGLPISVASLSAFIAVAVWIFSDSKQLSDSGP